MCIGCAFSFRPFLPGNDNRRRFSIMPKTKFQEFVYGVLMTFFMVLAMELYNTGLRMCR